MRYCPNCGAQLYEDQNVCPSCHADVYIQEKDNGGFGWGLLGCCLPIVGLILFLVWKDNKPKTAKAAGIGALVSVGFSIVYYILVLVLGVGSALV